MRRRPTRDAQWLAAPGRRMFFGPFKKKPEGGSPSASKLNPFNFNFQEMEKEINAAKAAGLQPPKPLLKMTEKNLQMMKTILNAQDKVKGNAPAGLGGALNKNEEFLRNLIHMQEVMLQQNPSGGQPAQPTLEQGAAGASSSTSATPGSGGSTTAQRPASTSSTPKIDLGPETEELFAELRSMREKKNEYKRQLEAKCLAYTALEADFTKAEDSSKDLRERLRRAEKDVTLLNSEALDLKEQLREFKQLKQKATSLENQVTSLKSQDTAPLQRKVEDLERQLAEKNEMLRSVTRKLDRSKKGNPVLQLSAFVADISRAAGPLFDSTKADDAILELQDAYATHMSTQWGLSDAQQFGASKSVELACVEFLARRLPRANYDASFAVSGNAELLIALLKQWGFVATVDPNTPGKYWVTIPNGTSPRNSLGPYGALYALLWNQQQQASSGGAAAPWRILKVNPAITAEMVNNPKRCTTRVETSRSSKPGGQATNVGETHIRVLLLVDGEVVMVSEAQDTRSAHTNKEYAWSRLFEEKIPSHNAKLEAMEATPISELTLKDDPTVARISRTRWEETLRPLQFSDPIASAAVAAVSEATKL